MAIGIASLVLAAAATPNVPSPVGSVVGGAAGVWEVRWADGTIDPLAVTAGLLELTADAFAGGDPLVGQILTAKNDVDNLARYQSNAIYATNGGDRYWLAYKMPNSTGLPWALGATHTKILGTLPQ